MAVAPVIAMEVEFLCQRMPSVWRQLDGAELFITDGTGFVGTWLLATILASRRCFGIRVASTILSRYPGSFFRRHPWGADPASAESSATSGTRFPIPRCARPLCSMALRIPMLAATRQIRPRLSMRTPRYRPGDRGGPVLALRQAAAQQLCGLRCPTTRSGTDGRGVPGGRPARCRFGDSCFGHSKPLAAGYGSRPSYLYVRPNFLSS